MSNALAFGTYVQGKSCIHQMNAQVKIILACVFSISIFFVDTWMGMVIFALPIVVGYLRSEIKVATALSGIMPVLLILLFTVLAHMFTGSVSKAPSLIPGDIPLGVPVESSQLSATCLSGLVTGMFFACRIALLVLACCLLTFTTSQTQVMTGLRSLMAPLHIVKIPVDDLCLVISMALRFVPTVTEEAMALRRSHEVRGMSYDGAWKALSSWGRLLVPLFVRLFQRADKLAVALEARCYGAGSRSSLRARKLRGCEVVLCTVGCVFAIVCAALL